DRGPDVERADRELGMCGRTEEDLGGRSRGDAGQQQGGESDASEEAAHPTGQTSFTGVNSFVKCSSRGSFFLMTPYSRRTSCIAPGAWTRMLPPKGNSGLEILCARSTASGVQPSRLAASGAASSGCSFMNTSARKIPRRPFLMISGSFLIAASEV